MFTVTWRFLHLICTDVLSNYIRIDMPQYQGIVYVYVLEHKLNKLNLRLLGVQHIIQENIIAEIHLFILIFAYLPLYIYFVSYIITDFSYWQRTIITEPLFVNVIFVMQNTEIKYFMAIVHVLNTKQNVIHIWIIGEVYTMVFHPILHLAEQIPLMPNIRTVAAIINFITVWALRWCFCLHAV